MSTETFLDGRVTLHCGDSREVLGHLPANSVDSVVCDPPYALVSIGKRFGKPGAAPASGNEAYARASAGFMGKSWDTGETAFSAAFWRQVLRVLKPGGHVVAFGGTRAYHRLVVAIEDAGFEIRDAIGEMCSLDPMVRGFVESLEPAQLDAFLRIADLIGFEGVLAWVYGTGFPKSLDVSKAIARRRVEDVEPIRAVCRFVRAAMERSGMTSRALAATFGCHSRLIDHWAARDSDSQPELPTVEHWAALKRCLPLGDEMDSEVSRLNARKGSRGDAWTNAPVTGVQTGHRFGFGEHRFTVTDPTIRELPEDTRFAQGWGTALKPAFEPICLARKPLAGTVAETVLMHGTGALNIDACRIASPEGGDTVAKGRHPANVLHDGSAEVITAFPAARGQQGVVTGNERGDGESAARFFYSAKADADDRLGSKHPTVKRVDLMQWLCRLVTPPGGVVLDPFAGTGTTGEAAWREGFRAVLIEREAEYQADIRRRMALCLAGPDERKREAAKAKNAAKAGDLGPLFGGEAAE